MSRCNARNPQGLAAWQSSRRSWKWGLASFFGFLAVISHFAPLVALVIPTVSTFMLGAHVRVRVRAKLQLVWSVIAFQTLMIAAFLVTILELPHYAWAIPLAATIQTLWTKSSDDPFENAKAQIVFRTTPYRS